METKVLLLAIGEDAAKDPMRFWHGVGLKSIENFLFNGLLWLLKERIRPPPPDPSQPEKRPPAAFHRAFCVCCFVVLLLHPMSNTVVGMQASLKRTDQVPLSASQVVRDTMMEHGLRGFFRGWQFSILLRFGSAATIVVYDLVRVRTFGILGRDMSNFVAGLLGRLSEVCACHPLRTLRARQQQGQPILPTKSLSALWELWSGVGLMALADAVKIGVRFLLIERMRLFLQWLLVQMGRCTVKSKEK